jgi:hypothetical protein
LRLEAGVADLPECAGMSLERAQSANGRGARETDPRLTHDDECDQSERADVEGVGGLK